MRLHSRAGKILARFVRFPPAAQHTLQTTRGRRDLLFKTLLWATFNGKGPTRTVLSACRCARLTLLVCFFTLETYRFNCKVGKEAAKSALPVAWFEVMVLRGECGNAGRHEGLS